MKSQSKWFIVALVVVFAVMTAGASDRSVPLAEQIRYKVKHFILDQVVADSIDLRVKVPSSITSGLKRSDITGIRVDWRKGHSALSGKVVVPVCLEVKKKTHLTTYATATIRVYRRVYVANRLLNRHSILNPEDVRLEMREVSGLNRQYFNAMVDILERRTRRVISAGSIITSDMIETPPLIRRGDRIQLTLVYGNMKVTTMGFARKDGWLGDKIRVRNPKNRSEIVGRVVNSKQVEVQL